MATASEDASLPPGVGRTVTVKGELPALLGTAAAHSLSKPTAATVRDLAKRLGVDGQVVERDGAFEVRGSGRTLTVQRSGQFSMYPGSPDGVACAKASPDGSVSDEPCDAPAPSPPPDAPTCAPDQPCSVPGSPGSAGGAGAGASGTGGSEPVAEPPLPSKDVEAERTRERAAAPPEQTKAPAVEVASSIVRRLGLDVVKAEASALGKESWSVQLELGANGVTAQGWQAAMTVTTAGVVTNAYGYLGRPAAIGDYPLAGTTKGIERLKGGVTGGDIATPAIACAEPNCGLPPTVVTGARLALTLVDTGVEAFLVPAYAFAIEGGGEQFVPAVTDEYLQKVQPQPGVGGREPAVDVGRPEPAPAPIADPAKPASAP